MKVWKNAILAVRLQKVDCRQSVIQRSVGIEFYRRAGREARKLGILAGAFNPPTRAHLGLAEAGLGAVDEVLFVLPRAFPHKEYESAAFEDRLNMLLTCTSGEPRYSVASIGGGLYVDIARECRKCYPPGTQVAVLCGRDAAERIVNWDYGYPGAVEEMLQEFEVLVASRGGDYDPPPGLRHRIRTIPIAPGFEDISATEVRERIRRGDPWEHLVPESVTRIVRGLYPK